MTTKKSLEGNTTRTRSREIYRDERVIEEARTYPAGETKDYSFQLKAPDINNTDSLGGMLGEALDLGLELLSGRDERLEWRIEARLDASGIDLADSARIYLNSGM